LDSPLFKEFKGSAILKKVEALAGDITLPKLGMSDEDLQTVIDNVSVIFHSAATVRFDEELKKSVMMNVEGTRSILELAQKMPGLESFVHVSTAYAHCSTQSRIDEKFYVNYDLDANQIIEQCNKSDNLVQDDIIGHHPNSYTFTKALAEQFLLENAQDLPLTIIRPSIVVASWKDPMPGWVDNFNGPTGLIAGFATGVFRTMFTNCEKAADFIPVDIAINVMIVAAWKTAQNQQNLMPPIYNVTSGEIKPLTWGEIEEYGIKSVYNYPVESVMWYPGGSFKNNAFHDRVSRWLFHYLPAYLIDALLAIFWRKPFMIRLVNKMTKSIDALQYFTTNEWSWSNANVAKLHQDLVETDPQSLKDFDFDIKSLNWRNFFENYVLGTRHYVLKNSPTSMEASKKKMRLLGFLHFTLQFVFGMFMIYKIYTAIY